jgi:hypothetical protein
MIMDYQLLHEIESLRLESASIRAFSDLARCLRSCGFVQHDDVFSLDRTDAVPPWQHFSIAEVRVLRADVEVYDEDGWDAVRLDYLFASLPLTLVDPFVAAAFSLSRCLNLAITYRGQLMNEQLALATFRGFADDLKRELYETPGSEELAIFIAQTYPRAKAAPP